MAFSYIWTSIYGVQNYNYYYNLFYLGLLCKKKKIAKLLPARLLCVVSVAVRKARGSRPLSGLHNRANVTAYIRQSYFLLYIFRDITITLALKTIHVFVKLYD